MTPENLPPPELPAPTVELSSPPPPPEAFTPPAAPPPLALAQPSPAVAFPVPVKATATVTETKLARYTPPVVTNAPVVKPVEAPQPQRLVFGEGEGKQPAPEYPRLALRQGQEGIVVARIQVGEDGSVLAVKLASPSPWPLLNDAALKVVRQRWHFRAGPPRIYDAPIRFEITK